MTGLSLLFAFGAPLGSHQGFGAPPLRIDAADVRDWLVVHGARIVTIVVILLVTHLLVRRLAPPAVRRAIFVGAAPGVPGELEKRASTLSGVAVKVSGLALFLIGIFMVLGEVGYSVTPVLTGLGISGIAIGLGAQGLVKDAINGLLILGENQFRVGDYITVAAVSGTVEDINLRRTILRDIDGTVHSVPNSAIQIASNHTRDYSGINVLVLVSHTADLELALAIATRVGEEVAAMPELIAEVVDPPRPARIDAIDEKGVTLRILGRVRPGAQVAVAFEYRRRLTEAFAAAGLRYQPAAAAPPPAASEAAAALGDRTRSAERRG